MRLHREAVPLVGELNLSDATVVRVSNADRKSALLSSVHEIAEVGLLAVQLFTKLGDANPAADDYGADHLDLLLAEFARTADLGERVENMVRQADECFS